MIELSEQKRKPEAKPMPRAPGIETDRDGDALASTPWFDEATGVILESSAEEIHAYLSQHPELAAVVPAVCARARELFGKEAGLALEIYRDPEFVDEYLTLIVRQACYDAEFSKNLDRVLEPYREVLSEGSCWMIVTSDFRC